MNTAELPITIHRDKLAASCGARGDEWLVEEEPLTGVEKALLEARLAAYDKDPGAGSSWAETEARIRARLKP